MSSIYEFSIPSTSGATLDFSDFEGRPLLLVNTASKCGFTGQYDGLQALNEEYGPKGLVVIGFPCDQFAHQEPGDDDEIEQFCRLNFGVTFPLTTKVDVNGSGTHPIFRFVRDRTSGLLGSSVKWNFTKFLVEPDGQTVRRYSPTTEPKDLAADIEELLGEEQVA
jgi:glutathione peroxidase-family protein